MIMIRLIVSDLDLLHQVITTKQDRVQGIKKLIDKR